MSPATSAPRDARGGALVRRAAWGEGQGELGHIRQGEGNAEGPLSLTTDATGKLVVLDQVNKRLVVSGPSGVERTVPLTSRTPEDVVGAKDGKLVVLDRTHDKAATVLDASGKAVATLPITPALVDEPGSVTGVFVDGDDVYAEVQHGSSVLLGSISGGPAKEKKELPGRPSRDGTLVLSAGITDMESGRVWVAAFDRKRDANRFTRQLRVDLPTPGLALLDSDKRGVIYLGVVIDHPGQHTVRVFCLEPEKGTTLGTVEVPATTQPEEQLRAFTVDEDGGIVHAMVEPGGVAYTRYTCGGG